MNKKEIRKWAGNIALFAAVMILTFWMVFRGQDMTAVVASMRQMSVKYLIVSVLLAVLFVCGEGTIIWYQLRCLGGRGGASGKKTENSSQSCGGEDRRTGQSSRSTLPRCIAYSFVGFFFSGITPSATGGQPVQLYYMKKDGNTLSESSVVLMVTAVIYKFVLVLLGAALLLFWRGPLRENLKGYYALYFVGLSLNIILVVLLLMVMFTPKIIRTVLYKGECLLVKIHLLKPSDERGKKLEQFLSGYQETVQFLRMHKSVVAVVTAGTFLQRSMLFLLTYTVYRGLGLSGTPLIDIFLLQASVYIAVDMLPIPGAQGITEAMYKTVFAKIIPAQYIVTSMCISRGISFYLMLLVGLAVTCIMHFSRQKT